MVGTWTWCVRLVSTSHPPIDHHYFINFIPRQTYPTISLLSAIAHPRGAQGPVASDPTGHSPSHSADPHTRPRHHDLGAYK
jgi:hypothetical protein